MSCSGNSPLESNKGSSGRPALLLVVESNFNINSNLELGFELLRSSAVPVFAEMFSVETEKLDKLSLSLIIDIYGEEWQIEQIKDIALPFYEKVSVLTDSRATANAVIDSLAMLKEAGYDIDMILNLHGYKESISFADRSWHIKDFISQIQDRKIVIRSLYQTCCYGSSMIGNWEKNQIASVNGSLHTNSFVIFSPIFFLQQWLSGSTFKQAVHTAYEMEISKIDTYSSQLPLIQYMITDEIKTHSWQRVGGLNTDLLWGQFTANR